MFWRNWRSRASRWGIVSAILAVAVLATGIGELSSSTVANGTVSTNELGVYVGALAPQSTDSFGRAVGHQPTFAMDFLDGGTWSTLVNEAPTYMSTWSGSGYDMVWGLPMLPNSFSADPNVADTSGSAYGLQQGAAGAYDSYFLKLAQEMVAGGQGGSIIRPGWEFNGNWFPWAADGQAAAFVGYWQQIVNTMRSVAGQNFRFEWNPTMGDTGIGNLADFYPGNAYVDEIGLDIYDQSWGTYTGISSEWNTFLTEPYGLNWLASFAASQGKPITFPEWGLDPDPSSNNGGPTSQPGSEVGGGDDPTFINDMAQWISQHNVLDASYWDYNSSQLSGSSNPNSYAAFKNDFSGAPTPTTTTTAPLSTTTTTAPDVTTTTTPDTTTTTTAPTETTTTTAPAQTTTTTTAPAQTTTTTTAPAETTTTTDPAQTTTTTTDPAETTTTTAPAETRRTDPGDTTTTTDPGDTTTPTTSGSIGHVETGGWQGTGPPPAHHHHHRRHRQASSTVQISNSTYRVVTSTTLQFSAFIRTRPSARKALPGSVMWTVTSRYGTPVPCPTEDSGRAPANGRTSCTIPSGQLSAAAAPYTVAVHYAGGEDVAPSTTTMVQRVARAGSTTAVVVDPTLLPGNLVQMGALVEGSPATLKMPTGSATFSVRASTGQPIPCQTEGTATLTSGVAACNFAADPSTDATYFVKISYHGDGNFGSVTSTRVVTVRSGVVSLQS